MDANQTEMNEMINTLQIADETLYQSNNPNDEINLSDSLLKSPVYAIQAIEQRGWKNRGFAEEGNRFAIRVLARIIDESDAPTAEKALDALVGVFATPDDNTTGWQGMLELAGGAIVGANMPGSQAKLSELKQNVTGMNVRAIDFMLNLLESQ